MLYTSFSSLNMDDKIYENKSKTDAPKKLERKTSDTFYYDTADEHFRFNSKSSAQSSCNVPQVSDTLKTLVNTNQKNKVPQETLNESLNTCKDQSVETISTLSSPSTSDKISRRCKLLSNKDMLHKSNSDPIQRSRRIFTAAKAAHLPTNSCNTFKHRRGPPVSKCMLRLDGYSYVIVASPPDKSLASEATTSSSSCSSPSKNGQLSKQGSLTILRRCSSKTLSGRTARMALSDDQKLDSVDLDSQTLPPVDAPEAPEKAALRLRVLLRKLRQGEIPASALQRNLQFAAEVLEAGFSEDAK